MARMFAAAKKLPPEECPRHMENSIDPVIKGAAGWKEKKKEDDGWFVTICQYGNKAGSPAPSRCKQGYNVGAKVPTDGIPFSFSLFIGPPPLGRPNSPKYTRVSHETTHNALSFVGFHRFSLVSRRRRGCAPPDTCAPRGDIDFCVPGKITAAAVE